MTKILLVEDNEMNRDMLSRRLKRRGFEVTIAVDGAIGVTLAQSEQPDLILMDMSLPVLDGWEATKQIKAMSQLASIPIIALTAHAMVGDREKALQAGCDDYDTKPVEIKRLLSKIEALIESAKQKSEETLVQECPPSISQPIIESQKAEPIVESQKAEPIVGSRKTESETEPQEVEPVLASPKNTSSRFDLDNIPILVVDDNVMNREVLGRRLKKVGYQIHFAETGEDALKVLMTDQIALVLLDVMMPGIGGWETLQRIRLQSTATELPVIMVTAKNESEDIVKAFSLGANDYITKPIDFPITLARVQSQLQLLQLSQTKHPQDVSSDQTSNHSPEEKKDNQPTKVTHHLPINEDSLSSTQQTQMASAREKASRSIFKVLAQSIDTGEAPTPASRLLNNQYKIFEPLNKTEYHHTFLAYDTHQKKETVVSIKRISFSGPLLDSLLLAKFQTEIERFELVFKNQTPRMIKLLDAFAKSNHIYLVHNYVEGSLLSAEIKSGRPHTMLYAINVLGRLLEILSVLHKHNIALQGFSTSSFTRRKLDGEIILTDLGLSKRLNQIFEKFDESNASQKQSPMSINFSEDLYIVGCIAIQALTGIMPKRYDGIYGNKRLEWAKEFDANSKCVSYINQLIHPDRTQRFTDAMQAHRELLQSHLLLHAVKHNMKQKSEISTD